MEFNQIIEQLLSYLKTYPLECGLLGLLLVAIIHQLYFYLRYIRKGAQKTVSSNADTLAENLPGVSVIVCARNEEDNLQNYLHNTQSKRLYLYM